MQLATLLTKEVQLYVTHENAANVFTAECHMAHADVMRHGHVVRVICLGGLIANK